MSYGLARFQPLPVEYQVLIIFAGGNRYLDDLETSEVRHFEREFFAFAKTNYPGLLKSLREKKAIDEAVKAEALKALDAFEETFKATQAAAAAN